MTFHLRGAWTLAKMRGPSQFTDDVAHGIYARMRGFIVSTARKSPQSNDMLIKR
jgi:hypothetical protein